MRVLKFGGGCLRDRESIRKVIEIIAGRKEKVVVVVSALRGITDLLKQAAMESLRSEESIKTALEKLRHRHLDMAGTGAAEFSGSLEEKLKTLQRLLLAVAYSKELTPSLQAQIESFGERLSAHLIAFLLNRTGTKAEPLEADEIPIVTDESWQMATADLRLTGEAVRSRVLPLLEEETIPVITGFFGKSRQGKITTFGRNGSDYTAAVVAACLGAEALELWKDVRGFMSADPAVVERAKKIEHLSYYEAAELSYFGARIVHPRTFEPLLRKGIPVIIKSLAFPSEEGTLISPTAPRPASGVRSITFNRNIAVLRVEGPGVGYKPGIIAMIGNALAQRGINIYSILTSQTCINLLLERGDGRKAYSCLEGMKNGIITGLHLDEGLALVGVVGEGLKRRKGIFARVFAAVADAGVNVEMVSAGASEVAYYFIVREETVEKAVRAIHSSFFPGC